MADNNKTQKNNNVGADFAARNNPFPTDAQLQETKAQRRGWIQKLRDKGMPEAITGTADYISDSVTPDTQEEYTEQMGMPAVGAASKINTKPVKSLINYLSYSKHINPKHGIHNEPFGEIVKKAKGVYGELIPEQEIDEIANNLLHSTIKSNSKKIIK